MLVRKDYIHMSRKPAMELIYFAPDLTCITGIPLAVLSCIHIEKHNVDRHVNNVDSSYILFNIDY